MTQEKKYRISKMHICSFETFDENRLQRDLQKYPERICIVDDSSDIVVDVKTKHQYPYVRTFNMLYFKNEIEKNKVILGKRFGCFEYDILALTNLSLKELKECKKVIDLLEQGYTFLDGNEELTNDEYLELINSEEKELMLQKTYKKDKKRK